MPYFFPGGQPNTGAPGKPIAPGSSLSLNATTGDDGNNGFDNPVQTDDRLQEILETYNWNDQSVNISFTGYIGGHTFSGTNVTGMRNLSLGMLFNTLTQSINIEDWRDTSISISSATFDDSGLIVKDISTFNGISLTFQNRTALNCVTVERAEEFICSTLNAISCSNENIINLEIVDKCNLQNFNLASCTLNGAVKTKDVTSLAVDVASISGISSFDLLEGIGFLGLADLSADSSLAIPGRIVNFQGSNCANTSVTIANLTESTDSVYPSSVALNGTTIRGSFVDDVAAGAGGVQSGHLFEDTTLGGVAVKS